MYCPYGERPLTRHIDLVRMLPAFTGIIINAHLLHHTLKSNKRIEYNERSMRAYRLGLGVDYTLSSWNDVSVRWRCRMGTLRKNNSNAVELEKIPGTK